MKLMVISLKSIRKGSKNNIRVYNLNLLLPYTWDSEQRCNLLYTVLAIFRELSSADTMATIVRDLT